MKCILMLASLLVCLIAAQAIKCYTCNPRTCNDPFNKANANETDCGPVSDVCVKQKTGGVVFVRGCGVSTSCTDSQTGGKDSCKTISVPVLGDSTTCCCTKEFCNSATTRHGNYALTFAMLLFLKAAF